MDDDESIVRPMLVILAGILVFTLAAAAVPALLSPPPDMPGPAADFDITYSQADETLVVQHAGGDALDARVLVVVADDATNETATLVWREADDRGSITYGDAVIIGQQGGPKDLERTVPFDLSRGDVVSVVWVGDIEGTERSLVLGRYTIGGTEDD